MVRAFATETGTDAFDDAASEAQATRMHQAGLASKQGREMGQHPLHLASRALVAHQKHDVLHALDGEGETEAIRVQLALRLGGTNHHRSNGVMGEQEGRPFLQSQLGQVAEHRRLADAQMGLGLITGHLDLPAFLREQAPLQGWGGKRMPQGGDHAMHFAHVRMGTVAVGVRARARVLDQQVCHGGLDALFTHAHLQRLVHAFAAASRQGGQGTAISQHLLLPEEQARRQACQDLRPTQAKSLQKGSPDKGAIKQHEHVSANAAPHSPPEPWLTGLARGDDGLQEEMSGHLHQIHTARLRRGAGGLAAGNAPEEACIGRALSHLFQGSSNGGEPIPPGKGSWGLWRGQWLAGPTQQPAHEPHAKLLAPMEKGSLTGHNRDGHAGQQTQARTQMHKDRAQALLAEEVPRKEQIHHHQLTELALPLFPPMQVAQQLTHQGARVALFEQRDRERLRKRVIARDVRYSERHEKVPFWIAGYRFFTVCQKRSFFSPYLTGIVPCGRHARPSTLAAKTDSVGQWYLGQKNRTSRRFSSDLRARAPPFGTKNDHRRARCAVRQ